MRRGKLIGLGVGPGDPELLTVKAARLLQDAQVVAYIAAAGRTSRARDIASRYIRSGARQLIAVMPMNQDTDATAQAYSQLVTGIVSELGQGQDVVFLCEGDPLLYGSFAHLLPRVGNRFECEVVPGVTSVSASAAAALVPLGIYDEAMALLPATMEAARLVRALQQCDRAVVMKIGRHVDKVRAALVEAKMSDHAVLVENVTLQEQRIRPLSVVTEHQVPYFSLIIAGRKRAPA